MLNNFWEEMNMSNDIRKFHENELSKMELPGWMLITCPFCKSSLPLTSIRSVSIKFNTRNMGDIALEVLCDECKKMDTVYYRQEIDKVTDFIGFLNGDKSPKNNPVIEEDMYKMQYNNVVEKMIKQGVD